MAGAGEEQLFDALAWRLAKAQPDLRDGAHRARMRGPGAAFADTAPLLAFPDPRRLDLRRSLTDPFGGFFVRRFERQTDIVLHLIVDGSASLDAGASSDRQGLAALLSAGLSHAAIRGGDRAALQMIGGDAVLAETVPSRRSGIAQEIGKLVSEAAPKGQGIAGLCAAAHALPLHRVLVAVISDFDLQPDELDQWLAALSPRPVLPVWLRDSGLENPSPRFGLAELRDPETGRRRTVLTTRKWAEAQANAARDQRAALRGVFQSHGLAPVEITDSIAVERLIEQVGEALL